MDCDSSCLDSSFFSSSASLFCESPMLDVLQPQAKTWTNYRIWTYTREPWHVPHGQEHSSGKEIQEGRTCTTQQIGFAANFSLIWITLGCHCSDSNGHMFKSEDFQRKEYGDRNSRCKVHVYIEKCIGHIAVVIEKCIGRMHFVCS